MNMKKGIIVIATIIVMVLGVFFANKLINKETNVSKNSSTKSSVLSNNELGKNEKTNDKKTNKNNLKTEDKISSDTTEKENNNKLKTTVEDEETMPKTDDTDRDVDNDRNDETTLKNGVKLGKYKVEEGDTLYTIAKTYMPNSDPNEVVKIIMEENSISNIDKIKIGDEIAIPFEEVSKPTSAQLGQKYVIKKGDSLYKIAKNQMSKYTEKQAIEKIKSTNNITNENDIKAGMTIYIPQ